MFQMTSAPFRPFSSAMRPCRVRRGVKKAMARETGIREPAVDRGVHEGVVDATPVELEAEVEEPNGNENSNGMSRMPMASTPSAAGDRQPQRRGTRKPVAALSGPSGNERATPLRRLVVRAQLLRVHLGSPSSGASTLLRGSLGAE